MISTLKYYFWFIKESQSFMEGYNPILIFFISLYKGIGFCKSMNAYNKLMEEEKMLWYANREPDVF